MTAQLAHHLQEVSAGQSLAERISAAEPKERAGLLVEAVLAGETVQLADADLRGLDLTAWQQGAATLVLDGANFSGATLSGANLSYASLRGARFDGALLVGADLHGADLAGASLRGAHLTGADLARSDLSGADLRDASLLTADLSDATASRADFREALLQSARFERTLLRMADMRWSHLVGARLAGADLAGARFEGAVLMLANLAGAQLSPSTDFSYAFLYQARLERTELQRVHVENGVGEMFTDLALARDTYRALKHHFRFAGRSQDARWAHRQQHIMATATHRPDQAARFHAHAWPNHASQDSKPKRHAPAKAEDSKSTAGAKILHLDRKTNMAKGEDLHNALEANLESQAISRPRSAGGRCADGLHRASHALRWLIGHVAAITSGYGTSFVRIAMTLVIVWASFAGLHALAGGLVKVDGTAVAWFDHLIFSAASLTPIDAYPLATLSVAGRIATIIEGGLGIVLLGAFGHILLSRVSLD